MIKSILCDMGGDIFLQDTEEAFRRFKEIGIKDPHEYMGAFGQKEFFLDIETGTIDADEFCRCLAKVVGKEYISWHEAQSCWLGFVRNVPVERLRELSRLRESYHLSLLSNTNPFIMDFTRSTRFSADGHSISDYFDSEFCSYEMGICKPSAEFFLHALSADGMKAEESIFIDDSAKNREAASALGIHVLPIETNEEWRPLLEKMLAEIN